MNDNGKQMQKRVSDEAMAHGARQLGPGSTLIHSGTAYQSALMVQVKRDIGELDLKNPEKLGGTVLRRSLAEAHLLGEEYFYAWEVNDRNADSGKKEIDGTTIHGAMMLLRNWGNAAVKVDLLQVDADAYLFEATVIDLESGATCPRLYRKHRSSPPGRYDKQRWDDMEFSDGQSRAIRNAICAAVPKWLIDRCKQQAFIAAEKSINPATECDDILARAVAVGVDQKRLETKMGKPMKQLTPADLVNLRAMIRTIEDGYAEVLDLFAYKEEKPARNQKPAAATMPADKQNETLASKFAKRIAASPNSIDLGAVGDKIAAAAKQKKLTDADVTELRKMYSAKLDTFEAAPSSPGEQPLEGELEPPKAPPTEEYAPE